MKKIITVDSADEKILHEPTKKIKVPSDTEIKDLIPEMVHIMHKANGLGLAAPQIGIPLRLCIIEIENELFVFVNPYITKHSKDTIVFEEGCLSVPEKFIPISRAEHVQVRFSNLNGDRKKMKTGGLLSIALQHEIDHLDGILIIDRAKSQKKLRRQNNTELARYYA